MIDERARLRGYNTDDKPSRDRDIFKFCYFGVPSGLSARKRDIKCPPTCKFIFF